MKLIYSPDKRYCISQFDHKGYTIFSYGKVETPELPISYIRVRNTWRDSWECLIDWHESTVMVYHSYNNFEYINLTDTSSLHLALMHDQQFYNYFFDKIPNEFIKVSSIPEYNTKQ